VRALRALVRLSLVGSLAVVLLSAAGCGGSKPDIGAPGVVPADIPADSKAALAEAERQAEEELKSPTKKSNERFIYD
jgi:hypothetical protein